MTEFDPNSETRKTPEPSLETASALSTSSAKTENFRLPLWLKVAILAVVVALASVAVVLSQLETRKHLKQHQIVPDDAEQIAQRKPVPDFILTDVSGATKKLSDFRGNVVILTFWASWCGPCLSELPTFAGIEKKFRDQGLRVLPVNVDEGEDGRKFAADFWPRKGIPFPTYYDVSKDLANQFEVDMIPSTFVIDRQGRLVFSSAGASDWSSTETQDLIESVLKEPST